MLDLITVVYEHCIDFVKVWILRFDFSYDLDPVILYFGVDNRVINLGLVSGYCLVNQRQARYK